MNREKSGSGPTDESAMPGFRLGRDGGIRVAPKAVAKLKTEVRRLWNARQNLTRSELRDQWAAYIRGWGDPFWLSWSTSASMDDKIAPESIRARRRYDSWLG